LASYNTAEGPFLQAMSEEDHVRLVVEAMEEIHGSVATEQYTGVYDRQSWASPYTGQHERYMPEYHKTHANHIL
jgi:monoamine oxidase